MIATYGIHRLAKSVSSPDFNEALKSLSDLARQANAEDKRGAFTAISGILIISITISVFAYLVTIRIIPPTIVKFYKEKSAEYSLRYDNKKEGEKAQKDAFDMILDNLDVILEALFGLGTGTFAYKQYKKYVKKANQQRYMEEAMQSEIDKLKEKLASEIKDAENASAAGVADNQSTFLKGNIVEIFNTFTNLMGIQSELPREKDETALEYFNKVTESINFPKSEGIKACKYFDDELYGKKNSTQQDKAAFMTLLLKMLDSVTVKTVKKSLDLRKE